MPDSYRLETKELKIIICNNAEIGEHRAGYNGVMNLVHKGQGINVFVPAYCGLNYETSSIAGLEQDKEQLFEPRRRPMTIERKTDGAIVLHQEPSDFKGIEATITFRCCEPFYIDQTVEIKFYKKLQDASEFSSLWASYVNAPENKHVYLIGRAKDDAEARWLDVTKESHGSPEYTVRNLGDDVETVIDHLQNQERQEASKIPIEDFVWEEPYYYGLYGDYVFIMMFAKKETVRFAYSPTGGGPTNPAWDYVFWLPNYDIGATYQFKARLAYKKYASREDIEGKFKEYQVI